VLLREVEYARPTSVEGALQLLASDEGARALAGGQTIVNVMKARAAAPDLLVDLARLDELRTIGRGADGGLELGAMVTYSQLLADSEVASARPVLREVCWQIADVQVRNRGTVGGNICSSDPTNHLPPLLAALGATMTILSAGGERTVSAGEFFIGVYLTAVGPGELLTRITLPAGGRDGFAAVTIGADGTCIVNAAANLDGEPTVVIGCVSAAPVVVRPGSTEDSTVREAVRAAVTHPPADVHASAEYRRHLAGVVAVRAIRQAKERS
jgi:aerobic carbon-monoxide dehydrogenase medium subunit